MNKFIKILPVASIAMIFISFLNLHLYYEHFGIEIQNYVDPSEIVFSLTTFIPGFFVFAFISIIVVIVTQIKRKKKVSFSVKLNDSFLIILFILSVSAFAILFTVIKIYQPSILYSVIEFDLGLALMIIIGSLGLTVGLSLITKSDIGSVPLTYFWIAMICLTSYAGLKLRNGHRAELLLIGYPKYSASFKLNNTTYSTNDSLVYVGATRNFYFLYSIPDSTSLIVAAGDVEEMKLRRLRTGL